MKQFFCIVSLLFSLTINSVAQPIIKFAQKEYDFGSINEADGPVTHTFTFTNAGTAPIIISEVITACGCTSVLKYDTIIAPAAKGSIQVEFNPKDIRGLFGKTITINSNASNASEDLKILGEIKPINTSFNYSGPFFKHGNLKFSSIKLSFDTILDSKISIDSILIVNVGNKPINISFDTLLENVSFHACSNVIMPEGFIYLVVKYNPTNKNIYGDFTERIQLITNDSIMPNKPFSVRGFINEDFSNLSATELESAPKIELKSTIFDFGEIKQGQKTEVVFEVSNAGKKDLIFRKIKPACGCTKINSDVKLLKPGEKTKLTFLFDSTGKSGKQDKHIVITTNDPKNSIIVLVIKGTVSI